MTMTWKQEVYKHTVHCYSFLCTTEHIILSQSCLSLNLSHKQIRMLLQIDSEFLCLYFFSHKNEPQNQHKCLVLSVLIAYRYAAHARAAWKLKGTGYEHLQFFSQERFTF